MEALVEKFLSEQRISVLSVLRADGVLHSATCHFAHSSEPLKFYILTEASTQKVKGLVDGPSAGATVTVGFSEEEWKELQTRGEMKAVSRGDEFEAAKKIFAAKFNPSLETDKDSVFIVFTAQWYRYTEFKSKPKGVIEHEQ